MTDFIDQQIDFLDNKVSLAFLESIKVNDLVDIVRTYAGLTRNFISILISPICQDILQCDAFKLVKYLNDPSINLEHLFGEQILSLLIEQLHYSITDTTFNVLSLLCNSTTINFINGKGNSPLIQTIHCNVNSQDKQRLLELLIKNGARVNLPDIRGNFALMIATQRKEIQIVKFLLENKADLFIKNDEGTSVFEMLYNTIENTFDDEQAELYDIIFCYASSQFLEDSTEYGMKTNAHEGKREYIHQYYAVLQYNRQLEEKQRHSQIQTLKESYEKKTHQVKQELAERELDKEKAKEIMNKALVELLENQDDANVWDYNENSWDDPRADETN